MGKKPKINLNNQFVCRLCVCLCEIMSLNLNDIFFSGRKKLSKSFEMTHDDECPFVNVVVVFIASFLLNFWKKQEFFSINIQ